MSPEDRIEILEAALQRIVQWADAYPLQVFPEVTADYSRRAHEVLQAHGMGIDRISASAMRHVVTQVRHIAAAALKQEE